MQTTFLFTALLVCVWLYDADSSPLKSRRGRLRNQKSPESNPMIMEIRNVDAIDNSLEQSAKWRKLDNSEVTALNNISDTIVLPSTHTTEVEDQQPLPELCTDSSKVLPVNENVVISSATASEPPSASVNLTLPLVTQQSASAFVDQLGALDSILFSTIVTKYWLVFFSRMMFKIRRFLSFVPSNDELIGFSHFLPLFSVIEPIWRIQMSRQSDRLVRVRLNYLFPISSLSAEDVAVLTVNGGLITAIVIAENIALYRAVFPVGFFQWSSIYRLQLRIEGETLINGEIQMSQMEKGVLSNAKWIKYSILWEQNSQLLSSNHWTHLYGRILSFYMVPLSMADGDILCLSQNAYFAGFALIRSPRISNASPVTEKCSVFLPTNLPPGKYRLIGLMSDVVSVARALLEVSLLSIDSEVGYDTLANNLIRMSHSYLLPHLTDPVIFAKSPVLVYTPFPHAPMGFSSSDQSAVQMSDNASVNTKTSALDLSCGIIIEDVYWMSKGQCAVAGQALDFGLKLLPINTLDRRDFGLKVAVSESVLTILLVHGYKKESKEDFYKLWRDGKTRPLFNGDTQQYSSSADLVYVTDTPFLLESTTTYPLSFQYYLPSDLILGLEYRLLFLVHDRVVSSFATSMEQLKKSVSVEKGPRPLSRKLEDSIPHLIGTASGIHWSTSTAQQSLWTSVVAATHPFRINATSNSPFPSGPACLCRIDDYTDQVSVTPSLNLSSGSSIEESTPVSSDSDEQDCMIFEFLE